MRPQTSSAHRQVPCAAARRRRKNTSESGFTLAAVIVLATIVMIFAAYTIPRAWSTIMKRERERQTIYAMHQYVMAIEEFKAKNGGMFPTSPQQLKDARQPRLIRGLKGEFVDALTGEVDWLVIPQSAAAALPQRNFVNPGNIGLPQPSPSPAPAPAPVPSTDSTATTGTNTGGPVTPAALPGIPIKDYAGGPFIGVRPPIHGKSLLTLFGADTYETWVYTTADYEQEKALRIGGASTVFH